MYSLNENTYCNIPSQFPNPPYETVTWTVLGSIAHKAGGGGGGIANINYIELKKVDEVISVPLVPELITNSNFYVFSMRK